MTRGIRLFLEDILESIELIESNTQGFMREDFERSPLVQDAVYRRVAIIGQAVKSIPDDIRNRYAAVPWRDIAGTRDYIVHAYFKMDTELVWDIVSQRLTGLKSVVERILADETGVV